MVATPDEMIELRGMLAERVPIGGTADDTLFTDDQIRRWIDSNPDLERAAYEGWRQKAAEYANLVNVTDGAASREFSDLLSNAMEMVKLYAKSASGPTEGRARVGRIVRR